jgi:hypothetical protein
VGLPAEPAREVTRFAWQDAHEQLLAFAARWPAARADAKGRAFVDVASGARLVLPFVLPEAVPGAAPLAHAARLPSRIGRCCIVLLQAGAAAIGYWDGDELLRHRARKKYVVRGAGRAQPLHQKTKGKSRYGSRLRLLNWKHLLQETNELLHECWRDHGAPEQVFLSVPVRALADLFAAVPAPPFGRGDATVRRVPLHVHVPRHEELLRVRRWLLRGRLESPSPG